jgi:hypothetical protein
MQRIRADGESACDALALAHAREGENRPYGQTIIKLLERFSCPAAAPGLVGILENKSEMKRRIGLIAAFKRTHQRPFSAAALFATLALVALTDAQPQPAAGTGQPEGDAGGADAHWRPWVVACSPRVGETEVDPAIPQIAVTFDRDMSEGMSWTRRDRSPCYPPLPEGRQAHWRDRRTCVLPVALTPDHQYSLGINSVAAVNFQSANGGVPCDPVAYAFKTRP